MKIIYALTMKCRSKTNLIIWKKYGKNTKITLSITGTGFPNKNSI